MPDLKLLFWNTQRLSNNSRYEKKVVCDALLSKLRPLNKDMAFFCELLDRPYPSIMLDPSGTKYLTVQKLVHSGLRRSALGYAAVAANSMEGKNVLVNCQLFPVHISNTFDVEGVVDGRFQLKADIHYDERSFQSIAIRAPGYVGCSKLEEGVNLHIITFHANSNRTDPFILLRAMVASLNAYTKNKREYWIIIGDLNIEPDIFNKKFFNYINGTKFENMASEMPGAVSKYKDMLAHRLVFTADNTHRGSYSRIELLDKTIDNKIKDKIQLEYDAFRDVMGGYSADVDKIDSIIADIHACTETVIG